ncbi:MAG: hypothetical protein AAGJ94_03155 [Pseudomonadota bacterium]
MAKMKIIIRQSVGDGGVNEELDVKAVQYYLNRLLYAGINEFGTELDQNGSWNDATRETLLGFQLLHLAYDSGEMANRRIHPGGETLMAMNKLLETMHYSHDREIALRFNSFQPYKHTSSEEREITLRRLRSFIVDGMLKRKNIDDRYFKFSYRDNWGIQRNVEENHNIQSIIKPGYATSLLEECRMTFGKIEDETDFAKAFLAYEHKFTLQAVLICRFFSLQGGTGDASTGHYDDEIVILNDLIARGEKESPQSIYHAYLKRYRATAATIKRKNDK